MGQLILQNNDLKFKIKEIEKDLGRLNYLVDKMYDTSLDEVSSKERQRLERVRDNKINQLIDLTKELQDEVSQEV